MVDMRMRNVLIVLFDGVQSLDVTGPLEVFSGANGYLTVHGDTAAYDITTASVGARTIRTSSGLTITSDTDLGAAATPHTLVVPGGQGTRCPDPDVVEWLRRNAVRAQRVVSV